MPTSRALKRRALALLPARLVFFRGPRTAKRLALSFDDGPHELTGEYLRVLDELDVPATFFLMGDLLEQAPHMLKRYIERGHQVASHGYDHSAFPSLSFDQLRLQLEKTNAALGAQPTPRPWVRPPYQKLTPKTLISLARLGVTIALSSVDSRDYGDTAASDIVAACTRDTIGPGDIFMFHEGLPGTLAALPAIVAHWRAQGYEFVTMADLMQLA
ncbi:MAG: polysaccharide deacetylase family protein [Myxococcales bacterium]|nr:polysaccharide deacetylase family protein [Myxococcales bacterium]